jgi:hypothetical protein
VIWWQHVLALAGGLALIGFLVFNYRRLPAIWRGDQAPTLRNPLFTVYPRSYVSYLCLLTAYVGGFALLLIAGGISGVASWARVLFNVSQWVMLAAVPILVGHWVVNALNLPRALVPPAYRDWPGTIARRRLVRERRRAGRPPTDHLVEIREYRPPPEIATPYLRAICTVDECDWEADEPEAHPVHLQRLREKVAGHTDTVSQQLVVIHADGRRESMPLRI